ncbi:hypothetical protein TrRE_jg12983, partial [Triparma retinervis]
MVVPKQASRIQSATVGFLQDTPSDDIRRGVPFSRAIANFGRVFRVHPNTLDHAAKTALYESSVPADFLDVFVSHSWSSPGYQKYISLLVCECGKPAIVAAVVSGLGVLLLQKFVAKLPFMVVEGAFDPIFEVYQESQPWEFLTSFIAGLFVLLFYPLFPCVSTKFFFIDCMVIHQTDVELKMRGIKSLGGFVTISKYLYVMWDADYFSRLWCVYELAVFKCIHKDQHNIVLLPLRQSVAILILIPAFFAGFLLYIILFPTVAPWGIATFYFAAFLASTVVYTGAAIVGYDFADQLLKLDEQLTRFEVSEAECYAPEDRDLILEKINKMYEGGLEEFNLAVRGDLREDVLKAVRYTPRTLLPYTTLLTGLIASIGFMFFGISWFRDSNTPTLVCFTIYMVTFSWAMMPLVTALSLYNGEALYKKRGAKKGAALTDHEDLMQALRRNKWRYLLIGVQGASIFIFIWTTLAFVLPLAVINSEEQPFLGVFPKSSAIFISLFTC